MRKVRKRREKGEVSNSANGRISPAGGGGSGLPVPGVD